MASDTQAKAGRSRLEEAAAAAVLLLGVAAAAVAAHWSHVVGVIAGSATSLLAARVLLLSRSAAGAGAGGGAGSALPTAARCGGVLCALLLAVRLASPDSAAPTSFPAACPPSLPDGCTRVAASAPHRADTLQPLHLAAPLSTVGAAVGYWVRLLEPRGTLLSAAPPLPAPYGVPRTPAPPAATPLLLRARFVSRFWGFADDTLVQLSCDRRGVTLVEAQSQLRLGSSDFGVNLARTRSLFDFLARTFESDAGAAAGAHEAAASASGGGAEAARGGGGADEREASQLAAQLLQSAAAGAGERPGGGSSDFCRQ